MAIPGVLMRLGAQQPDTAPATPCPGVEATYVLAADDAKSPSGNTIYFLSDISPLLHDSSAYDEDVRTHGSHGISWVVCAFINGRNKSAAGGVSASIHAIPGTPSKGSVVVVNGATPRADKEQDYHDWYDQEHGDKLTLVPGWNWARRYKQMQSYGDVETASFYGINFYEEENGLGGSVWKDGVSTAWTLKIRTNAAKPNIRRVWKVADVRELTCF